MKWFNNSETRLVKIGFFIAILLLIGDISKADFTFGEPMKVGPPVNSSFTDATPYISADGFNLYFTSTRTNGQGSLDLWMATFIEYVVNKSAFFLG
jgi:hypothetical protein